MFPVSEISETLIDDLPVNTEERGKSCRVGATPHLYSQDSSPLLCLPRKISRSIPSVHLITSTVLALFLACLPVAAKKTS